MVKETAAVATTEMIGEAIKQIQPHLIIFCVKHSSLDITWQN